MKLAVQLYTLRHDYSNGEEFLKLLEKVKEIGFDGVEFAGYAELEPEVIKAKLDELGLVAVGCHMGIENYTDENLAKTIEIGKALDMKYMGVGGAPHSTKEEVDYLVKVYSEANKIGEKEGIKFYYHNHSEEFENEIDGKLIMDRIAEGAYLEIDTYWSFFGGADNYKYITEHKDDIILLHIKDGLDGHPKALGEGNNDLLSVFKAAKETGIEWLVLENDDPVPNGIDDIKRSMEFFKANL
ncbi:MAG: sugar phosphate isomerase/epimerase [Ruminococcus sp.]|nr:sugar phosphate isomerase/epimerase [Candidatus Copronaster equi]